MVAENLYQMMKLTTQNLDDALVASDRALAAESTERWHRDLPYDEMLFDRWERASRLGFGKGSSVYHNCYVYGDVTVGENTWVGPMTVLDGSGGLSIGDFCSISAGTHIYTHDSVRWALSGGAADCERASVSIGSCTYIGSQVVVGKGVQIGSHVVVGAGSFVNHDVPDNAVVVGSPARVVGSVQMTEAGPKLIFDVKTMTEEEIIR